MDFQRIKLPSRYVTMCAGILCAVLLAGANHRASAVNTQTEPLQSSHNATTTERKQLEATMTNLTKEKNQWQQSYKTLKQENHQLQTSCNETQMKFEGLQTNYSNLQDEVLELGISLLESHSDYLSIFVEKIDLEIECDTLNESLNDLQTRFSHFKTSVLQIARKADDQLEKMAIKISTMRCREGWTKFGSNCYVFSGSIKKDWQSSRTTCINTGADLVIINSRAEQEFVNGLMEAGNDAWIGLTDSLEEGTWKWVDGTPVTIEFWEDDQPNNFKGNQDCGETARRSTRVGQWRDYMCSYEQPFICEQ